MGRRRTALIAGGIALGSVAAILAYAIRWRRNPSACPYGQRFFLEVPHPFITRKRLREILDPKPGERVLEVGPGTGYYALRMARWLQPDGTLDVLDLQQEMLDHTERRARELGITNVVPTRGDARTLPYADGTFEATYSAAVLGEVPDQDAVLGELRRVLKPGGRLVVGELLADPHMVTFGSLRTRAAGAGLLFERQLGGRLGYFARFLNPNLGYPRASSPRRPLPGMRLVRSTTSGERWVPEPTAQLKPLVSSRSLSGSRVSKNSGSRENAGVPRANPSQRMVAKPPSGRRPTVPPDSRLKVSRPAIPLREG